jgi:hypothetical protein
MSDMPCVSVCAPFGIYMYVYCLYVYCDNNVFCNKRHPEDGLMGPKHVGA